VPWWRPLWEALGTLRLKRGTRGEKLGGAGGVASTSVYKEHVLTESSRNIREVKCMVITRGAPTWPKL